MFFALALTLTLTLTQLLSVNVILFDGSRDKQQPVSSLPNFLLTSPLANVMGPNAESRAPNCKKHITKHSVKILFGA